jgi:hypothetical protein
MSQEDNRKVRNSLEYPAAFDLPKTLRYCKVCQKQTPHRIRAGDGLVARICVACLEHIQGYELDRD